MKVVLATYVIFYQQLFDMNERSYPLFLKHAEPWSLSLSTLPSPL